MIPCGVRLLVPVRFPDLQLVPDRLLPAQPFAGETPVRTGSPSSILPCRLLSRMDQATLRCVLWRQWKQGPTRSRKLRAFGVSDEKARAGAGNGRGPWRSAGSSHLNLALPSAHFTRQGLLSLVASHQSLQPLA